LSLEAGRAVGRFNQVKRCGSCPNGTVSTHRGSAHQLVFETRICVGYAAEPVIGDQSTRNGALGAFAGAAAASEVMTLD
jgi:hypothetical protein